MVPYAGCSDSTSFAIPDATIDTWMLQPCAKTPQTAGAGADVAVCTGRFGVFGLVAMDPRGSNSNAVISIRSYWEDAGFRGWTGVSLDAIRIFEDESVPDGRRLIDWLREEQVDYPVQLCVTFVAELVKVSDGRLGDVEAMCGPAGTWQIATIPTLPQVDASSELTANIVQMFVEMANDDVQMAIYTALIYEPSAEVLAVLESGAPWAVEAGSCTVGGCSIVGANGQRLTALVGENQRLVEEIVAG